MAVSKDGDVFCGCTYDKSPVSWGLFSTPDFGNSHGYMYENWRSFEVLGSSIRMDLFAVSISCLGRTSKLGEACK